MAEDRSAETPDIDYDAWRANIRRDVRTNYHYSMARAVTREGNRAVAIEHLRRALDADPAMVPAYAEMALLLREDGRASEADAAEAEATRLSPSWQAEAALRRGQELAAVNRLDEALAALAEAETAPALRRQARGEIAEIHFTHALRHHAAGDLDATFAAMRTALGYDDGNPTLLHHISYQYEAAGDLATAILCATKAAALVSEERREAYYAHAAAMIWRAPVLPDLTPYLKMLTPYAPALDGVHLLLACTQARYVGTAAAEQAVRAAVALNPDDQKTCATAFLAASPDDEERALSRLLAMNPQMPIAHAFLIVRACVREGVPRGRELFDRVFAGSKRAALIPVACNVILLAMEGRTGEARSALETVRQQYVAYPWLIRWRLERLYAAHADVLMALTGGASPLGEP